MLMQLQRYVRKGQTMVGKWLADPRVHGALRGAAYVLSGCLLSAASLGHMAMPLGFALVMSSTGWSSVLAAVGSFLGYRLFWGVAGQMGVLWVLVGLPVALILSWKRLNQTMPLLLPAVASLITAASGVFFQMVFLDNTGVAIYILRVVLSGLATGLFSQLQRGRNAILQWLGAALGVLALAQVAPFPWFGLGYLAAGIIATAGAFPGAALAGLALDLAQVTPVPMTAVLALAYLPRFLQKYPRWAQAVSPVMVYVLVMGLCNHWDLLPIPALAVGGILGIWLPLPGRSSYRRGETGVAQVRLEMAAGVLSQTQQVLMEQIQTPVDEQALVEKAAERACSTCSYRKGCRDSRRLRQIPSVVLHKPLLNSEELPITCRKTGRLLAELHRGQEQLRSIQADRERQQEYRAAVVQQYRFLAAFLQDLSDHLSRRGETAMRFYTPVVTLCANRPEADNGDRCLRFAGTGSRYYVLLCDGMGRGMGAVQEGRTAGSILQRLLTAGFPAEHALRSLNSLCALRDRPGAVSIDLAEIFLDTGKVILYKWGAAPSYLIDQSGAQKLGLPGPPPGLSVTDYREKTEHFSLRRGQWLVMVSDGIAEEEALRLCRSPEEQDAQTLARKILDRGQLGGADDATVAVIHLKIANT